MLLLHETNGCAAAFRRLTVSYHCGLERLLGFPKHFRHHYTCKVLNVFTFEHHLKNKMVKFCSRMEDGNSVCMIAHKYKLTNHSGFTKYVNSILSSVYDVGMYFLKTRLQYSVKERFCSAAQAF